MRYAHFYPFMTNSMLYCGNSPFYKGFKIKIIKNYE